MNFPARPQDEGAILGGIHSATFALGGHTIGLKRESAGRVTVTFNSR